MKRYSVLYLLNERYHHILCESHEEAQRVLAAVLADRRRKAVGIYDSKTELIDWAPNALRTYNQASIGEQSKLAEKHIGIAQALRRRDMSWQTTLDSRRPSFFA